MTAWDVVRRLDKALLPFLGPAQLGDPDEVFETVVKPCPLCGGVLADHEFERSATRPTRMHCPV
jgi:ribosomal protein S27AE